MKETELTKLVQDMQKKITFLTSAVNELANAAKDNHGEAEWHPIEEPTPPDGLYLIKTDKGARYCQQLIKGKWMPDVRYWMAIPE